MQCWTIGEVCDALRVSKSTLWRFRRRYPDFPKPIMLNNYPRWVVEEIDAWLLRRRDGEA